MASAANGVSAANISVMTASSGEKHQARGEASL